MGKREKIFWQPMRGNADQNIGFDDWVVLDSPGFEKRIKGSHHVFSKGLKKSLTFSPQVEKQSPIRSSRQGAAF